MSKRKVLLTLLIHRRTKEEYYQEHDLHIAKQKAWLKDIRREPFDSMPEDKRTHYLDSWFWPPWRFNDIVGFAELELETPTDIIGHLYLPKGRITKVTKKPLLLNYACASVHFENDDLQSLQDAIFEVIEQLNSLVRKRKWILEINQEVIEHTDFLAMTEEMDHIDHN